MNIIRLVANGINLAKRLTTDVQKLVTYIRVKGSTYNATDGNSTANQVIATGITAIITPYEEDEDEPDQKKMGRELVVIDFRELNAQGISSVDVDDLIVEPNGPERQVVSFKIDPTRQVVKLVTKQQDSLDRGNQIHGEGGTPISGEGNVPIFGA